ncbi:MAG: hypothetical protein IJF03_12265 [Lachnospiraceae bacterium]|nr:hypothetical protein [Lachnospiraceae bacterium]
MTDSEKLSFLVEAVTKQDKKMDALEESLKEEIQEVRSELREEIQDVRSELKDVRNELKEVQDDVTGVKLIMENELRRNISIIAENHLDLYEKLSEYKKVTDEQFHPSMRVNTLESYVKELKKERTA